MEPSINDVGNLEGGGVKDWSKLQAKKLPTWGRGMSKIRKNCRHRLWMVPMYGNVWRVSEHRNTKLLAKCKSFFASP